MVFFSPFSSGNLRCHRLGLEIEERYAMILRGGNLFTLKLCDRYLDAEPGLVVMDQKAFST